MTTKMNCVCDHINGCLKKGVILIKFGASWWISFNYLAFKPPFLYLSINRDTLNTSLDFLHILAECGVTVKLCKMCNYSSWGHCTRLIK